MKKNKFILLILSILANLNFLYSMDGNNFNKKQKINDQSEFIGRNAEDEQKENNSDLSADAMDTTEQDMRLANLLAAATSSNDAVDLQPKNENSNKSKKRSFENTQELQILSTLALNTASKNKIENSSPENSIQNIKCNSINCPLCKYSDQELFNTLNSFWGGNHNFELDIRKCPDLSKHIINGIPLVFYLAKNFMEHDCRIIAHLPGSQLRTLDKNNRNLLHVAITLSTRSTNWNNHALMKESYESMLKYCDINQKDSFGHTPLDIAIEFVKENKFEAPRHRRLLMTRIEQLISLNAIVDPKNYEIIKKMPGSRSKAMATRIFEAARKQTQITAERNLQQSPNRLDIITNFVLDNNDMKVFTNKQDTSKTTNTECIICQEDFKIADEVYNLNDCNHLYCQECFEDLTRRNATTPQRPTCPGCRTEIKQKASKTIIHSLASFNILSESPSPTNISPSNESLDNKNDLAVQTFMEMENKLRAIYNKCKQYPAELSTNVQKIKLGGNPEQMTRDEIIGEIEYLEYAINTYQDAYYGHFSILYKESQTIFTQIQSFMKKNKSPQIDIIFKGASKYPKLMKSVKNEFDSTLEMIQSRIQFYKNSLNDSSNVPVPVNFYIPAIAAVNNNYSAAAASNNYSAAAANSYNSNYSASAASNNSSRNYSTTSSNYYAANNNHSNNYAAANDYSLAAANSYNSNYAAAVANNNYFIPVQDSGINSQNDSLNYLPDDIDIDSFFNPNY